MSRIIIDSNILIGFLITKEFEQLDEIIFSKQGVLVFSEELLEEFLKITNRPKLRLCFSYIKVEEMLETIDEFAVFVKVNTSVDICKDPKDNFLLSLSVDGNADYLLTTDRDLLALKKFGKTSILTFSKFLQKNKQQVRPTNSAASRHL